MFIDYYSEISKVRLVIGDYKEPFDLVDDIITIQLSKYASDVENVKIWKASLACLEVMIAEAANHSTRLREREGSVEIEEYRNERYKTLKERYKELISTPPEELSSESSVIYIGGVSKKASKKANTEDSISPPIGIGWFDKGE